MAVVKRMKIRSEKKESLTLKSQNSNAQVEQKCFCFSILPAGKDYETTQKLYKTGLFWKNIPTQNIKKHQK